MQKIKSCNFSDFGELHNQIGLLIFNFEVMRANEDLIDKLKHNRKRLEVPTFINDKLSKEITFDHVKQDIIQLLTEYNNI